MSSSYEMRSHSVLQTKKTEDTGYRTIRTTAPLMFVEQETSWQGDNCKLIIMKDYFP